MRLEAIEAALGSLPRGEPEVADRHAAVALVLRQRDADVEALLIRRAERDGDPWSGHMALPGGRVEPGETPLATAVREAREEVGLDLGSLGRYVGRLPEHHALSGGILRPLAVTPCVFALEAEPPPLDLDGSEVSEALWVSLGALRSGGLAARFTWSRPGIAAMVLPCWDYDGRRIWGLTHRILTTLFGLVTAP